MWTRCEDPAGHPASRRAAGAAAADRGYGSTSLRWTSKWEANGCGSAPRAPASHRARSSCTWARAALGFGSHPSR